MDIFTTISLLGGLSLFLYGMDVMGDGLGKSSGNALKTALEKVTNSPVVGFMLGLLVTCLIQSSTATIALTVGLISAGMLTFSQSISVVLGANVGTTITAQIIRLLDIDSSAGAMLNFFKPSTLAPFAAIVGIILIMFIKRSGAASIGRILMGFGILFTGLINMTGAVSGLTNSTLFYDILAKFSTAPLLGFLVGLGMTAVIQSSSAAVGIVQALASTGSLIFSSIYSVLLGINIGTCLAIALVCCINTKADAKRVFLIHTIYNVLGSILIVIALTVAKQLGWLDGIWNSVMSSGDIANTHTLFKLSTALVLLPFTKLMERFCCKAIKDEPPSAEEAELSIFDDKLFGSPVLALENAHDAIGTMCNLAQNSIKTAFGLFENFDPKVIDKIKSDEDRIDRFADGVDGYLARMSTAPNIDDEGDLINYYVQCFVAFERLGDYAVNLSENATELQNKQRSFSEATMKELSVLTEAINEIVAYTKKTFDDGDLTAARSIEPLEQVIDILVDTLKERHAERMHSPNYSISAGLVFMELLAGVERISDHCSNVAFYTLALHDPDMEQNQHEYLNQVHEGADLFYRSSYDGFYSRFVASLGANS